MKWEKFIGWALLFYLPMVRKGSGAAAGLPCVVIFVLALASVPLAVAEEEGNPAGEVILAESDFMWDVDGWTTRGAAENFQHGQKMIKASDTGPATWYFVAPSKFLGAKRAAYGGKLSFRHGFFEYNRCLEPPNHQLFTFPEICNPPIVEMLNAAHISKTAHYKSC